MEIKQKGCVVTGAGSGIGRGIALALADAGASGIIIADVQLERAEAVCAEIEAKGGWPAPSDVTCANPNRSRGWRTLRGTHWDT
jgi:meso-butanediol dehydrogenase / (S,S)-butanediol dehydrogenase / diacetyl reductase